MKRYSGTVLLLAALSLSLPSLHASPQENSENHRHGQDHDSENDQRHDDDRENGHGKGHAYGHEKQQQRYFRAQDNDYLVRYYDGPRQLPPGLRKKYYRNGTLPPGWLTGFRPMPPVVIQQLPPLPYGYQRGYYDGYAVVVDPRTRVIVDVIDIVGALSGR